MGNDRDDTQQHKVLSILSPSQRLVAAGLLSGVVSSSFFSPFDRALYLSVVNVTPLFASANWRNPYQGVSQSIVHRSFSSGMYFPLVDLLIPKCRDALSSFGPAVVSFTAGNIAGGINGLLFNWLTAIKYANWGTTMNARETAVKMYTKGGLIPFARGLGPTLLRDAVFGGVFATIKFRVGSTQKHDEETKHNKKMKESSRHASKGLSGVAVSLVAGCAATIFSSPFNYARNVAYAAQPSETVPHTFRAIGILIRDSRLDANPVRYAAKRLRIGAGTARVAIGMTVGGELYARFVGLLEPDDET